MYGQSLNINKAVFAFAIPLFFSLMLPYHVNPFPSFYNDWLVAFGCVLAIAYFVQAPTISVSLPAIVFLPIGLIAIIVVQSLIGMVYSEDAILSLGYLVIASLAIILGASLAYTEKSGAAKLCKGLAYTFLISGLLSTVIATCQFTHTETAFVPFMMEMLHNSVTIRPIGNLAQTNQLALLFCMAIASVWWLFQTEKLQPNLAICMIFCLIWGLALTQSRIGWIIVPILAFFGWSWSRQGRCIVLWVPIIFVVAYATLVVSLPSLNSLMTNGGAIEAQRAGAISARLILFQQAWKISVMHPWLGAGWLQFAPAQVAIATEFAPSSYSAHAHNIVLNFAAEIGWPSTLLMLGGLGYWVIKSCFVLKKSRETSFAFLCIFPVIIHSMVEYPLWYGYILFPICLLVGMIHQEQFESRIAKFFGWKLCVVALLMSVCLVGIATDYRRVVVGYWWNNWEPLAISMGAKKIEEPAITIFSHFYDYLKFQNIQLHPGMAVGEIAAMEKVAKRFAYGESYLRLSLAYGLNGRESDAVKAMLTIYSLSPNYYSEAYGAWKRTAFDHPKYLSLLRQLPSPKVSENLKYNS